jgi:hypothetical protein
MRKTPFCLLALFLIGGAALLAQDIRWLPDFEGKASMLVTKATKESMVDLGLSPSDTDAYNQELRRLADLLLSQPALKAPRGVELKCWLQIGSVGDLGRKDPVPSVGFVQFYPYLQGTVKPTIPKECSVEMYIQVNDPKICLVLGAGDYRDSQGRRIFREPRKVGEFQGFPVYSRSAVIFDMLILTRSRRPIWKPLTREEFIRGEIRRMGKELATMGLAVQSSTDPLRRQMEKHNAALAAMSAAERQAQARFLQDFKGLGPDLAPIGSSDGIPLVVANPDWFDPSLPRWAIQLIVVGFEYGPRFDPENPKFDKDIGVAPLRLLETRQTTDWKAISSLLK